MRQVAWLATFRLRDENPKRLAERILSRPARLEMEWAGKNGRETRLYVPDDDSTLLCIDEIVTQHEAGLWRRVRHADRPGR